MRDMKTVSISKRSKFRTLHIEAPGCIVNIHVGLTDNDGREVTHVSVSADGDRYAGDREWWAETQGDILFGDRKGVGVRIVRHEKKSAAVAS